MELSELPQDFLSRMENLLQDEYPLFLGSYEQPRHYGLRVNTLKISVDEFRRISPFHLSPIPWTVNGFFYEEEDAPARHPFYYAGLYYLQEPSAMAPAQFLPVAPGEHVLDLCAAPGGKATELAAKLQNKGLLVANDISASRSKALLKNLEIFGVTNSFVTSSDPATLAGLFPEAFDKILVDAPCSGEGMFRKDPAAARAWSVDKVKDCAKRQKEIVMQAVSMLRPGGMMLYSTCTFSTEENEEVISFLLENCDFMELMPLPQKDGFCSCSREDLQGCVRLFPHRLPGEGHFMALLAKKGGTGCKTGVSGTRTEKITGAACKDKKNYRNTSPDMAVLSRFLEENLRSDSEFLAKLTGSRDKIDIREGKAYFVPDPPPIRRGIRFLRNGLYLGEIRKDRFEPSQAFAMALKNTDSSAFLDFDCSDERIRKYLAGEMIEAEGNNGLKLICVNGFPLGWGKLVNGTLKNKYHAGWRIQI